MLRKRTKTTFAAITAILLFMYITASAASGDIAGKYYSTDIVAYMYDAPVTSYNIGGKTCIDAEILNWYYGFDVYWYEEQRHLDITDKGNGFISLQAISGELVESKSTQPGTAVGNYFETDITVTLNGNPIESYNIGGRTVICAEAMSEFGYNVNWSEENRTLKISKPMDFYTYFSDYGEIKSMYDFKLPRGNRLVFYERGVNVRTGEELFVLATPSNRIYVSPGGQTYMKLSDLVAILNGTCNMTETEAKEISNPANVVKDTGCYAYNFNLNYNTNISPVLVKADDAEVARADITDDGLYSVELLTANMTVNGEEFKIMSMYGGKEFESALKIVQNEVYIPVYSIAKLLGYEFAW